MPILPGAPRSLKSNENTVFTIRFGFLDFKPVTNQGLRFFGQFLYICVVRVVMGNKHMMREVK